MKFKPANIFSEHMVIQQGVNVPVWGWSVPGDEITVQFLPADSSSNKKQIVKARADKSGKWIVNLQPLVACAIPARLMFYSQRMDETIEITDVLVGEVWLASGQSNMEWMVRDSLNAEDEIASANFPSIRMFTVPRIVRDTSPIDVEGGWSVCTPQSVGEFSAVAYFFGRELHNSLQVPVGLINSSWGGTRIETWISRQALIADPLCAEEVRGYEAVLASMQTQDWKLQAEQYRKDLLSWLRTHMVQDPGNKGYGQGWAKPDFDDSQWQEMELPLPWQRGGVDGNGVVWFRRAVDIPAKWAGHEIVLHLGACDKHDVAYFNNTQVGVTGWETSSPWTVLRVYKIPHNLVQSGRCVITVRIYSYRNAGGMIGPRDEMYLECPEVDKTRIPLCGKWRYMVEHNFGVIRGNAGEPAQVPNQNSPYALFDNMIAPIVPYAIRGVIWYQGERNTETPHLYRTRFPMLIRNWRDVWGEPELPFLFVQLANYQPIVPSSGKDGWAELREAQFLALKEPNTAMAVTIDIGDPIDIHPRNKQDVGKRLALCAEALVYGMNVVYSGPLYKKYVIKGECIRISFSHTGTGLMVKGNKLKGFFISGVNKQFVPAEAIIEGDTVVVRSSDIKSPAAVRYGWSANPECNLYNKEGLPASPFRTDNWSESC